MNILEIFRSFQTQEQAIEYLESVRWRGHPVCPYCKGDKICRHASGDRASMRWQCWGCERTFSVTVGTIFHGTHIPLKNWFLLLALMLNAKESPSASRISRDLGIRRPTVWSMMHRITLAIIKDREQKELLYGIVEANETYLARRLNTENRHFSEKLKGGRSTAVAGSTERGGIVVPRTTKSGKVK
jgi:transposase-like protein